MSELLRRELVEVISENVVSLIELYEYGVYNDEDCFKQKLKKVIEGTLYAFKDRLADKEDVKDCINNLAIKLGILI